MAKVRSAGKALAKGLVGAAALLLVVLLVALGLAPFLAKEIINRKLTGMPGYQGHVEHIHWIWEGPGPGFHIEGIRLSQLNPKGDTYMEARVPLARAVVRMTSLVSGPYGLRVYVERPGVVIDQRFSPARPPVEEPEQLPDRLKRLPAFRLEELRVRNGRVAVTHLMEGRRPVATLTDVDLRVRGLTNRREPESSEFGTFQMTARPLGEAPLKVKGRVDWLQTPPAFNITGELERFPLPAANPFFRELAGLDVEKGQYSLYFEMAAQRGDLAGYVKPVIENFNAFRLEEDVQEGLGSAVVEGLADAVMALVENPNTDTSATRIPIRGNLKQLEPGFWGAVASLFQHVLISPLQRGTEGSIDFSDVGSAAE